MITRMIARLLSPYAMLAILLGSGFADLARAQPLPFPTPSKTLCMGDPSLPAPATCLPATPLPGGTTTPPPFVPVFYAVTLMPNATGAFTLLETLPLDFTFVGASCTVAGSGTATTLLLSSLSGAVSKLGPFNVVSGQTVICFIRGYFKTPGATVSNSVAVGDPAGNPVSNPAGHNAIVTSPQFFPSDLSVTKTSEPPPPSPPSVDVSLGPKTIKYTIVIKNNGPQAVYIGAIFELLDKFSTPSNPVPLQVRLVPGSVVCTPSPLGPSPPNTDCLDPNPVPGSGLQPVGSWGTVTTASLDFAKWRFPAGASGYMPVGGTMTLTYKVEVRRHPSLYCAIGGEKLRNQAFFRLTSILGQTIAEAPNTTANNTATSPDIMVKTGQGIDPDCALPDPIPGPITIIKKQLTPTPANGIPWTTNISTTPPVTYRITVKNSDPNPIVVRLRDRVMEWAGTPPFTVTAVNWTCIPIGACGPPPPPPPGGTVPLLGYFATATAWDKLNITVPGSGGTVEMKITLKYVRTSCDSFAAGDNLIRNYARVNYVFGSVPIMAETFVQTKMASPPLCNFKVEKKIGTAKVEFGVPLNFQVFYHNAENFPVTVGTLIDAVRIVQPNYATQLAFDYSYSCAPIPGSSVTGAVPGTLPTTAGTIVHTTLPSQGTRIIQNTSGPVLFGPNSTLKCNVTITVKRPAPGDANCLSSVEPRLENLALMDVSNFYNSNLPWPPSGTYIPNNPFGISQPLPLTNWQTVGLKLPKCYRLIVNKTSSPGLSWAPGGPSPLTYTIDVKNAGDTITGTSSNTNVWNGPFLGDFFPPGSPYAPVPGSVTVTSLCSNPAATWPLSFGAPAWSGPPAANGSTLMINTFPAGCTIRLTFKVAGPFKPGRICNIAGVGVAMAPLFAPGPTDSANWYANDPNPNLLMMERCVDVLETNRLLIRKMIKNNAGIEISPEMRFPMSVSCVTPLPSVIGGLSHVPVNPPEVVPNLPVGTLCTINELWSQLPVHGQGRCKPPAVPVWQAPTYSPAQSALIAAPPAEHMITVTNSVECVSPPVNSLTVTKTFEPPSLAAQVPATAVFPVQVECNTLPPVVLNLGAPNFQGLVTSIPVGTLCKIAEQPPQGIKIPAYCKWAQTYPNGASVVIPAQGNPNLVVQNSLICNPPIDLSITKTGPNPVPGAPGLFTFTMTVTSPGGPFTIPSGALKVTDIATGLAGSFFSMTATPAGAWTCSTLPSTGTCTYNGTGPTVAGQVLGTFTMSYYMFAGPRPFVNCASVSLAPSAGLLETNLQNNTACLSGGPPRPRVDLAIKKSGPVAVPGSPGLSAFTLHVTNPGPPFTMPANGLTVTDTATGMAGNFTGISATPGGNWNCGVAGTTGNCVYTGSGTITTGQVLGTITITYHAWALSNFTNCATVALANIAPLDDINQVNNKACVTVSVVKPKIVPPAGPSHTSMKVTKIIKNAAVGQALPRPLPAFAVNVNCAPNGADTRLSLTASKSELIGNIPVGSNCTITETIPPVDSPNPANCKWVSTLVIDKVSRPNGYRITNLQAQPNPHSVEVNNAYVCEPALAVPQVACPAGTIARGGDCVRPLACRAPMTPNAAGTDCACPAGTVQEGRECVRQPAACTPPMIASAAGGCACPPGTVQDGRQCVRQPAACTPPMIASAAGGCACPPGTVQDGRQCVRQPAACTPPMIASAAGGCACPPGTVQDGRQCVRQPAACTPPMIANAAGGCACPPGTVQDGRQCVRQPAACAPPMIANAAGTCACPEGTVQSGRECVGVARPDSRDPRTSPRDPRGEVREVPSEQRSNPRDPRGGAIGDKPR